MTKNRKCFLIYFFNFFYFVLNKVWLFYEKISSGEPFCLWRHHMHLDVFGVLNIPMASWFHSLVWLCTFRTLVQKDQIHNSREYLRTDRSMDSPRNLCCECVLRRFWLGFVHCTSWIFRMINGKGTNYHLLYQPPSWKLYLAFEA